MKQKIKSHRRARSARGGEPMALFYAQQRVPAGRHNTHSAAASYRAAKSIEAENAAGAPSHAQNRKPGGLLEAEIGGQRPCLCVCFRAWMHEQKHMSISRAAWRNAEEKLPLPRCYDSVGTHHLSRAAAQRRSARMTFFWQKRTPGQSFLCPDDGGEGEI